MEQIDTPPSPQTHEWTFRRVMWATFVLVAVALSFWLLYRFYQVVFMLFIAIVIGTAIRPAVTWLYSHGVPRMTGTIIVYLVLLSLFVGFVLLLFPLILEQGLTVAATIPGYYQSLREGMSNFPNMWIVRLSEFLPASLPGLPSLQQSGQQVHDSAGQAWGFVKLAAKIIFTTIVILLLAFHWTVNGPRSVQSLLLIVPKSQRLDISELISMMENKVGFYIAGQAVLCLAIGILALIAYLLIGLPNALVLALIAGVLEAVPMVGPLLGAIPAAVIGLSIAPSKLIWVIVSTVIIQQVENTLLVPRVMRKAVGINPFVSLLSIFAFSSLFGIAGALMAIPMAAIAQILLDRLVFNPGTNESEAAPGRDLASRLRYEAQDLAQDLRKQARLNKAGTDQWLQQTDQVLDEIEAITTDLDSLLAQAPTTGTP